MKLKCLKLTTVTWPGWTQEVRLFPFLNICPQCLNSHIKIINVSIWWKDPQMPIRKLKRLMCWNKILAMLWKSYRQQFDFTISMFFGSFLNSPPILHIKAHHFKKQTRSSRCWLAIWGMKAKNLISRNHKARSIELPAPFRTLHIDIMLKESFWMIQSAEFEASLGTLNTLDFSVCFLSSNT